MFLPNSQIPATFLQKSESKNNQQKERPAVIAEYQSEKTTRLVRLLSLSIDPNECDIGNSMTHNIKQGKRHIGIEVNNPRKPRNSSSSKQKLFGNIEQACSEIFPNYFYDVQQQQQNIKGTNDRYDPTTARNMKKVLINKPVKRTVIRYVPVYYRIQGCCINRNCF